MKRPVGALTAADAQFLHQTTETFANVATSDPARSERAYGCALAKDGAAHRWGSAARRSPPRSGTAVRTAGG